MKDKEVQTDYGIPFVMDIPFLGNFFRKTVISKEKDELLVFVTPRIVTPENLDELNKPIDNLQQKSEEMKARLVR
jgi:type II secretory pathway component GspD/PulD (secretin)